MERASLRRVPSRPQGPVAPADALSHVTEELPGLDPAATAAFALVALVGRPRRELAGSADADAAADLSPDALAEALARARKALRRKLHPLPGSGWCERAERLISDRLDDALVDPGPAHLEVHLANCDRCVEHERRLGQAQDALVAGFEKAHPADSPASKGAPAQPESELPPALRVVDTPALPAAEPAALPAPDENAGELAQHEPATAEPSTDIVEAPAASAPLAAPAPSSAPARVRPPRPAWIAPAPMAPVRPAHWTASPPAPPARPAHPSAPGPAPAPAWPSTPRSYEAAWPAPALETRAARGAIEDDEWASLAPLLAVLFAAIAVLGIAGLLAI